MAARAPGGGGAEPASRRERKKQNTRDRIQETAWALFTERGYNQTTIRDITDGVDIAERTFFRYFASKEDVLATYDATLHLRCAACLREQPVDEAPWFAVRDALCGAAGEFEANRARLLLRHGILGHPGDDGTRHLSGLTGVLEEVIAERLGVAVGDVSAAVIARSAVAAAGYAYMQWLATEATTDLAPLFADAFDALVYAVYGGTSPG